MLDDRRLVGLVDALGRGVVAQVREHVLGQPRCSSDRDNGAVPGPRCPCGSGETLVECCGRLHDGTVPAATAEQLMRSRFSAFALGDAPYLLATWHSSTRPTGLDLDPDVRWTHLDVLATTGGALLDAEGIVEFAAHYLAPEGTGGRRAGIQLERSRFLREAGRWTYLDAISLS